MPSSSPLVMPLEMPRIRVGAITFVPGLKVEISYSDARYLSITLNITTRYTMTCGMRFHPCVRGVESRELKCVLLGNYFRNKAQFLHMIQR